MAFKADGPRQHSEFKNAETARLVKRALDLAAQPGRNKVDTEIVNAIMVANESGDAVAIDALDPDSKRNMRLPESARTNLRRAQELADQSSSGGVR